MPHLVFVYGTLMQGERNHRHLKGARFAGEGSTAAAFDLLDMGRYPALVAGGACAVRGEIWEVDDATLERLDELEEVPELYRREELVLEGGTTVFAWVMTRQRAGNAPAIPTGDWRRRTGR